MATEIAHTCSDGCTSQIGMSLPEPEADRIRWAKAALPMTMAFCEAGYPAKLRHQSALFPDRENEIQFRGGFPPDAVMLKAADLAGVRDIMQGWLDTGRPSGGQALKDGSLEWRLHP